MALLQPPRRHVLLTGKPGIGKTTILMEVARDLPEGHCLGFLTEALHRQGRRMGFEVVTLDGRRAPLAQKREGRSGTRIGPYVVELESFEALVLPLLERMLSHPRPVLIDEIGKMECLSAAFRSHVWRVLEEGPPAIATVPLGGSTPFLRTLKERPDIELLEVTALERDKLPEMLRKAILDWK